MLSSTDNSEQYLGLEWPLESWQMASVVVVWTDVFEASLLRRSLEFRRLNVG